MENITIKLTLGALVATLAACQGGGSGTKPIPPDEEAQNNTPNAAVLCAGCKPVDREALSAGTVSAVACDGSAISREEITLEAARGMGFDPDAQLDAAETKALVPVRWQHLGDETEATIEVTRTGMATLVRWKMDEDPQGPTVHCHDGDYVVPTVQVKVSTADGLLDGSFEAGLGPDDHGNQQPEDGAGGTSLTLMGDASQMTGSLGLDVQPGHSATLAITVNLLFDHDYVDARGEIYLALDYISEGDEPELPNEALTASPADDCTVRSIPVGTVAALDLPAGAVEASSECTQRNADSDAVCCSLQRAE